MTDRPSPRRKARFPSRLIAALAGFALLPASSAEGPVSLDTTGDLDNRAQAATAAVEVEVEDRDCLLVVWEEQEAPDRNFDRAHDMAEGGLISCATGTSASQYEATLSALRNAASGQDQETMLGEVAIPLLYIDAQGNRRELMDVDLADGDFDTVFSPEMLELMRGLKLYDMTVVPGQGGFFALGAIWLSPGEPGERPRLVTVNRQALAEANAAQEAETSS